VGAATTVATGAFARLQVLLAGEAPHPARPPAKAGLLLRKPGHASGAVNAGGLPVQSHRTNDTAAITSSDPNATLLPMLFGGRTKVSASRSKRRQPDGDGKAR